MKMDLTTDWFYKYPADSFSISYNFTNDISTGDTLASCTASIYDSSNNDKTASMISSTSVTTPRVSFTISSGTGGETYSVKLLGETVAARKFTHYLTCDVFGVLVLNNKLGDVNANSYVTLDQANNYIRDKYGHNNVWDTLSTEGKKRVLIEATNDMDSFNYVGEKYYDSQKLQFPRDDNEKVSGDCATPFTENSFLNANLYNTTYGKIQADYWKYGTCHITAGTPIYDIRQITSSSATNGMVTMLDDFTATPNANTDFIIFAPLDKEIQDAQCEQTLYIIKNTSIESLQDYKSIGAESVKIGDTSIKFREGGSSTKTAVSSTTRKLLSRWIKRAFTILRA